MFSRLFRRSTTARPATRSVLRVEHLEAREIPSRSIGIGGDLPINNKPVILDFNWTSASPYLITFTGRVVDDQDVTALSVRLDGSVHGVEDQMVEIFSDGTFSWTVQLPIHPNSTGTVTCDFTDVFGLAADTVWIFVDPSL